MTLVLDAGAFVALERGDSAVWERFTLSLAAGEVPVSHGGVIGQVWRGGGPRQARLARALESVHIRGLGEALGRAAGELMAKARTADVVDAALVLLAHEGDSLVTSDPDDLLILALAAGRTVEIVRA
jgi:hypothetical protein